MLSTKSTPQQKSETTASYDDETSCFASSNCFVKSVVTCWWSSCSYLRAGDDSRVSDSANPRRGGPRERA